MCPLALYSFSPVLIFFGYVLDQRVFVCVPIKALGALLIPTSQLDTHVSWGVRCSNDQKTRCRPSQGEHACVREAFFLPLCLALSSVTEALEELLRPREHPAGIDNRFLLADSLASHRSRVTRTRKGEVSLCTGGDFFAKRSPPWLIAGVCTFSSQQGRNVCRLVTSLLSHWHARQQQSNSSP